jgi:uncharacterized protein (DUF983 family)
VSERDGRTDPERLPALTAGRVLGRALLLRCPVCGGGGLFRRWFTQADRCPTCGFRFHRVEGHWIGSLGMNTIVSFGALLVAVVVGFALTTPDPPAGLLVGVAMVVAAVVPMVFFPWSRTLWSAIDLLMRPLEPDDEVDPRYWPGTKPPRRR